MLPLPCMLVCIFVLRKSHARPRVQQAPGLPCALYLEEGRTKMQASDAMRREIAKSRRTECPALRSEHDRKPKKTAGIIPPF